MSPFPNSQKEPDIYIRPYNSDSKFLPPIAFEVGWSVPAQKLEDDVRILLEGGNGHIRAVIVVDWCLQNDGLTVTGKVDLWRRGSDGQPIHKKSEVWPKIRWRFLSIYTLTSPRIFTLFQRCSGDRSNVLNSLSTTCSQIPYDLSKTQPLSYTLMSSICARKPKVSLKSWNIKPLDIISCHRLSTCCSYS